MLKAAFIGASLFKKQFAHSTCALFVSANQLKDENEKIKATIFLINKSQFTRCTIAICDTLQRHTLSIKETILEEAAYQKALWIGDEWIKKNKNIISQLIVPFEIVRWNRWLNNPEYNKCRRIIEDFYSEDANFRDIVKNEIYLYLKRTNKIQYKNNKKYFKVCLDYLLEECAVELLLPQEKFAFKIYTGSKTKAIITAYDKFCRSIYPDLENWLSVRFYKTNPVK